MLQIIVAESANHIGQAQELFREYGSAREILPCVRDFERELATLPGAYGSPEGRLFLAFEEGQESAGQPAGCVALRKFGHDSCEMKRLYVRPAFRGKGVGMMLVEKLISDARSIGYTRMVLDTLPTMREAHKLYRQLGFREIPAYWKNPIPGVLYFELLLH
jgi:ribosomal protein S18 acetylase RimI-like enzyme